MGKSREKKDITKPSRNLLAPGHPGVEPKWSSGAKTAVGTSLSLESRVWFTIQNGVIGEVYFPDVDCANTRSLRFLIAAEDGFFSDELYDASHKVEFIAQGVPAYRITTTCKQGRYRLIKEVIADPARDTLLIDLQFEPTPGRQQDLALYVHLNPHVGDFGFDNRGWVGDYHGVPMLFAERNGLALALASSASGTAMTCGYVGKSDGLTDIRAHKRLTRCYTEARDGNVALTAGIDWRASGGRSRIALGLGGSAAEAAFQARGGILQDFASLRESYVNGWSDEQSKFLSLDAVQHHPVNLYRASVAVMRTHESKRYPGGFVASLSIPWGFSRGDEATGGYHVLWPRDLGETALGLLAASDAGSARRAIFYLRCTQGQDGNWTQNMWLDGTPHWDSTQMDGTSFGILIADALRRSSELAETEAWPMIRAAAGFLLRHGPYTEQDRWESNSGYSPYTIAVQVAALLAAADFADLQCEAELAELCRATADAWNDAVEELTYVSGTKLARKHKVDGYYVRIMPAGILSGTSSQRLTIKLANRPALSRHYLAEDIVSPDALALVRFGLRSADDPKILDTIKLIDATLKTETATGPVWHRYTHDGYGEHNDGSPHGKTGIGRGWPLLAGERAHYEIARGNFAEAERLRTVIEAQTSECGMIPEQVWDAPDIPERLLYNGHPSGSSMPLAWAHSEYVKLLRSLAEQAVWNMPPQTVQRYQVEKRRSPYQIWTLDQPRAQVSSGKDLRVDSPDALAVRWKADGWPAHEEVRTHDSGLGMRWAVLRTSELKSGTRVEFSLWHPGNKQLSERSFEVKVQEGHSH